QLRHSGTWLPFGCASQYGVSSSQIVHGASSEFANGVGPAGTPIVRPSSWDPRQKKKTPARKRRDDRRRLSSGSSWRAPLECSSSAFCPHRSAPHLQTDANGSTNK